MEANFCNNTEGWVYCFSHPSFEGVYMIGKTQSSPDVRALEMSDKGHFLNYKVECAKFVDDHYKMESALHTILSLYRVRHDRDFFIIPLKKIRQLFDTIGGEEYAHIYDSDDVM